MSNARLEKLMQLREQAIILSLDAQLAGEDEISKSATDSAFEASEMIDALFS